MSCWIARTSSRSAGSSLMACFCRSELAAFVTAHGCQGGEDDLVGALTPGGSYLEEQVAGARLNFDGGGVGHDQEVYCW